MQILSSAFGCIGTTAVVLKIFENSLPKRIFVGICFLTISLEILVFLNALGFIGYNIQHGWTLEPIWSIVLMSSVFLYIAFTTMISVPLIFNFKIKNICPQFFYLSYMDRFASNGKSDYEFIKLDGHDCIKISLRNFSRCVERTSDFTTVGDCGVIFEKITNYPFLSKGFKINDKNFVEIEIKGAKGEEKVGLAMKNTDGQEMKVSFDKLFKGGVTNSWNSIRVDLAKEFQHVVVCQDKNRNKYLENFSIFTNTNMTKKKSEKQISKKQISEEQISEEQISEEQISEEQIVFIRRISFIK